MATAFPLTTGLVLIALTCLVTASMTRSRSLPPVVVVVGLGGHVVALALLVHATVVANRVARLAAPPTSGSSTT